MAFGADDACTNSTEFKIDRRCYVTDKQKKDPPFNAIVALIKNKNIYCTGTIVKGFNGYQDTKATEQDKDTLFVYTAKHCVVKNDQLTEMQSIMLQDNTTYTVKLKYNGRYIKNWSKSFGGDWAIYTMPNTENNIPYTKTSDKWGWLGQRSLDARVIGYGALKIMSDDAITEFKKQYSIFLEDKNLPKTIGFYNGGGGH